MLTEKKKSTEQVNICMTLEIFEKYKRLVEIFMGVILL